MSNLEYYYYGQGEVMIARILPGNAPLKWRKAWDVSALTLACSVEGFTHRESMSGAKEEVRKLTTARSGTATMTMHNINPANVALAVYGEEHVVAGGTVTDEVLPAVEAGETIFLEHTGVSDLEIVDSTGAPVTLAPENYALERDYGQLDFLTLPSAPAPTQPFKASYAHAGLVEVGILATKQPEIALRYKGINLAEGNAPVMVDLWRLATDPLTELPFINNEQALAGMPLSGTLLADPTKSATGPLGRLGRVRWLTPAAEDTP